MSEYVLPGNPPVALTLKKSSRARRISLRVSRLDGRVTLTVPAGVREKEALAFAETKGPWLRKNLAEQEQPIFIGFGTELPILGDTHVVTASDERGIACKEGKLHVSGQADQVGRRVLAYLKTTARDQLCEAADKYAGKLGQDFTRITLRDTRSRWGSCTSDGGLMFSWRLVMAPAAVLNYVAAHEVAHLVEMNHSTAFWNIVTQIYGDHRDQRRWLRENGPMLHRYRFGN